MTGFHKEERWFVGEVQLIDEPATEFEPVYVLDSNFLPHVVYATKDEYGTYTVIRQGFEGAMGEPYDDAVEFEVKAEDVPEAIKNG